MISALHVIQAIALAGFAVVVAAVLFSRSG